MDPRHRKVVKTFSRYHPERLLDVGCGDGRFSHLLAEVAGAREVYGIDISEQGTELARRNGVKAIQLDVDNGSFPFEDGFFDAVFCGEVIEHLYDPDHLLDEVHRVLKASGLLVLSTPNMAWWVNRVALPLGFYPFGLNPGLRHSLGHMRELPPTERGFPVFSDHLKLFTVPALLKLLRIHGFEVRGVKGIGGQIPSTIPLSRAFNAIDKMLSLRPSLSFRCVIWCLKKTAAGGGNGR